MRYVPATIAALVLCTTAAMAVDPDELRERTRPQVQREEKTDVPPPAHQALSEAFKKFNTMHMLTWRVAPGGAVVFAGQFTSAEHCAAARKKLTGQLVRLKWGAAECLELVQP